MKELIVRSERRLKDSEETLKRGREALMQGEEVLKRLSNNKVKEEMKAP